MLEINGTTITLTRGDSLKVTVTPVNQNGTDYVASGAETEELFQNHPVYCFRKGKIQMFTGIEAELDALEASITA